ncbi:hypothetical protein NMY22_g2304 [Coprinellus aureogranulatus]|nr:hypothetical protein NMY22_g2304 [Coprinellus aureogranulatus]
MSRLLGSSDDDSHVGDASSLGELSVTINAFEQWKTVKRKQGKGIPKSDLSNLDDTVVNEMAKKSLTNCVQLGELRPLNREREAPSMKNKSKKRAMRDVDIPANPVVAGIVVFKYRRMDVLIADGIAPRPAAVPGASSSRGSAETRDRTNAPSGGNVAGTPVKQEPLDLTSDNEQDSDEELERLRARASALQELCEVNARIEALESKKRAREGEPSQTSKRVKKEPKISPFVPGVVIDLT